MSNNYYQNITYQQNVYSNQSNLNPMYKEPIKRETIYEKVKVHQPLILSAAETNNYFQNINSNNLYSEYPSTNVNNTNDNDILNKYFSQTNNINYISNGYTTSISNNYQKINTQNKNVINNNNNPYLTTNEYLVTNYHEKIPINQIEFAQITKISNNAIDANKKKINQNNPLPQDLNQIAQVKKITEEKKQKITTNTNINNKLLPNLAKISKITTTTRNINTTTNNITTNINNNTNKMYMNLNPKVKIAKQEKSISNVNVVKLNTNNENNNITTNIVNSNNNKTDITINKINEEKKIINEVNNIEIKTPEIKKELIEQNIQNLNENNNYVNKNNNMIILNNKLNKGPKDDYDSQAKTSDNKFHQVKILKKNDSNNQMFFDNKILDIGDYNYLDNQNKQKPKVVIINRKKSKNNRSNIEEDINNYIQIKTVNKINNNYNEYENQKFYKTATDEYNNNDNNNFDNENEENEINNESQNDESDRHDSDIVDNNFDFNEEKVKDEDKDDMSDVVFNKEENMETRLEDSKIKKIKNNDGLDEFDNNFNIHDIFYNKMRKIFDE